MLNRLQNSRFFFFKSSKEIGKACRKSLTRAKRVRREKKTSLPRSRSLFSASFQTFCLTARAYLNTQKYGLFRSLHVKCLSRAIKTGLQEGCEIRISSKVFRGFRPMELGTRESAAD